MANCIYGQEEKLKWDSNLVEYKFTPFGNNMSKHCGLLYTLNKKQASYWARDFNEKVFTVSRNGVLYRFSSSSFRCRDGAIFFQVLNTLQSSCSVMFLMAFNKFWSRAVYRASCIIMHHSKKTKQNKNQFFFSRRSSFAQEKHVQRTDST